MLVAANSAVPRIQPADLRDRMSKGDVVVVDVRDAPELATGGKIKGAVHVPRGMLEFRADPESPYHNPALRKEKTVVLYCASGGRSALAGKTLQELGYKCLSTKTPRSVAPSSTWAASYLRPSSAAFITTIAESSFQYTQV